MTGDRVEVDRRAFDEGRHWFGPYAVKKSVTPHKRPFMKLRARDVPPSGRSIFRVEHAGHEVVCELQAVDAFPAEVRRGIDGTLDGQPLRIAKRWLAPIAIVTPKVDCRVTRLGVFGWRLRRTSDDAELASQRRGRITVCDDLTLSEAAVTVAVTEAGVVEAVSPVAWLRGL